MPKKTFKTRANKFFRPIAISIISILLVAGIVKAATTVGTNISSDGTLTIAGTATFSGNMTVGNAGSDALVLNSGVWTLGSTATTTVAMTNGINFDSNTFVIDPSSGRLGIGTASPANLLHIFSSTGNGDVRIEDITPGLEFANIGGSANNKNWKLYALNNNFYADIAGDEWSGGYNWLQVIRNGLNVDYINFPLGNIGIGTTSPAALLSLQGAAGSSDIFAIASSTGVSLMMVDKSGNVGIGTSAPISKVDIIDSSNNRLLTLGSNTTASWTNVGTSTGWTADNEVIQDMESWNGKLYVGLGHNTSGGSEVWELTSTSTWTQVGGDGVNSSWTTGYEKITSISVFNDRLLASTGYNGGDGELWEYNGSTWTKIGGDGVNSGWPSAREVQSLASLNGKLYAGLGYGSPERGQIWVYDGNSWTQIGGNGINSSWSTDYDTIFSMTVYEDKLYAGLGWNSGEAEVWEYNGSNTWTKVGGDSVNSSWESSSKVQFMEVYNNKLFAGIDTGGIWEYDGTSWTQIGGNGTGWSSGAVYRMTVYNGKLYAGVGAKLMEYDGSTWTQIGGEGTGWNSETAESVIVHNGKLYAGLRASPPQLWEYDGSSWTSISRQNNVGLSIGNYIFMDRNGYVGINDSYPESTLDVKGDFRVGDALLVAKNRYVTSAGDMGVGTSTPDAKLTVRQDASSDIVNIYDGSTKVFSILDGGIASTTALKINDNAAQGSTIEHLLFGTCSNLFGGELIAGAATTTACSATGVTTAHKIFITPKNNQTAYFNISSASSTADNILSIGGYNSTSTAITVDNNISIEWLGIK